MKCYLQNTQGTIRRVDKLKELQDSLPKDSDYSRRVLLCQQNNLPWEPYILQMSRADFAHFQCQIGDAKPKAVVQEYKVFDQSEVCLLRIINNGK